MASVVRIGLVSQIHSPPCPRPIYNDHLSDLAPIRSLISAERKSKLCLDGLHAAGLLTFFRISSSLFHLGGLLLSVCNCLLFLSFCVPLAAYFIFRTARPRPHRIRTGREPLPATRPKWRSVSHLCLARAGATGLSSSLPPPTTPAWWKPAWCRTTADTPRTACRQCRNRLSDRSSVAPTRRFRGF